MSNIKLWLIGASKKTDE